MPKDRVAEDQEPPEDLDDTFSADRPWSPGLGRRLWHRRNPRHMRPASRADAVVTTVSDAPWPGQSLPTDVDLHSAPHRRDLLRAATQAALVSHAVATQRELAEAVVEAVSYGYGPDDEPMCILDPGAPSEAVEWARQLCQAASMTFDQLVRAITERLEADDATPVEERAERDAAVLARLLAQLGPALAATILALALTASRRLAPQTTSGATSPRSAAPPGRRRHRHRPVAGCLRRASAKEAGCHARLHRASRCRRHSATVAGC